MKQKRKERCDKIRIKKICPICGEDFFVKSSEFQTRKRCSAACYAKHQSIYKRGENNSNWKGGITFSKSGPRSGSKSIYNPKHPRAHKGHVLEQYLIAEKALGKPLPPKVVIHHSNKNLGDNKSSFNLVICENQSYHRLLHTRQNKLQKGELI